MSHERVTASLRGGWSLLRDDPVGVLLPAIGVLGSQALALALLQAWWRDLSVMGLTGVALALIVTRTVVAAPFRAAYLASAARQLGRPFSIVARTPGLATVWALSAVVEALLVGSLLTATLGPAWWLFARATWWAAVLLITLTTLPILLVGIASRVVFAYATIEVTAGHQSIGRALSRGARSSVDDGPAVLLLLLAGETLMSVGGLLCGAGALPGVAYADLALLHRWTHRQETS